MLEASRSSKAGVSHTLQDWLYVHNVTPPAISRALKGAIANPKKTYPAETKHSVPDCGDAAWALVVQTIADFFPGHVDQIDLVRRSCELRLDAQDEPRPYTLDQGPDRFPLVSLNYAGNTADLLNVAHEFAHALQIHIAGGVFIPPILRELAAFLGELIVMAAFGGQLFAAWQDDNSNYLGSDLTMLETALRDDASPYSYRWNYPIARLLASRIFETVSAEEIWGVFEGQYTLRDLLRIADMNQRDRLQNPLPEMPKPDPDRASLNAYRVLGAITLLDIEHGQDNARSPQGEYYEMRLEQMRARRVMLATDDALKPIGYSVLEMPSNSPDDLGQMIAPFGNEEEVIESLAKRRRKGKAEHGAA